MILYPAIDLRGGQVVRLLHGAYDQETRYEADPVALGRRYADAGAAWLHLVDLDGARDPATRQHETLRRMIEALPQQVQVGGGIRTEADVEALLSLGAARVVVGSVAVQAPERVAGWLDRYGPDRIVAALDVRLGDDGEARLATHGWRTQTDTLLTALLMTYRPHGLRHVLCTDIARDGALQGPNVALYQSILAAFPEIDLQASGGVTGLDDVRALDAAGAHGAVIGRALLERRFTLEEALAC